LVCRVISSEKSPTFPDHALGCSDDLGIPFLRRF
jgi:hypothetical protein